MSDKVPGERVYVTHEKMNSVMWKIVGALGACTVILAGGIWSLSEKFERSDDRALLRLSEVAKDLGLVREDVAVIKVQINSLAKVTEIKDGDVHQAQYILVQLPPGEAELEDQRIRDILTKQGHIDGETER